MLDVLHYLPAQSQREVLQRVRAALPPGGLLLLRVGDASGGMRFRFTRWVDSLIMRARGRGAAALHCRRIEQWRELLYEWRFDSRPEPLRPRPPLAQLPPVPLAGQGRSG